MKKEEYMGALQSALSSFDEELVQEIVSDYEERFRIGLEKGKTEEQVIAELGSIKDLVDELGELQQGTGENAKTEFNRADNHTDGNTQNGEAGSSYSGSQSGTYYQEKSFAETFDAAMKKFGKVFDTVMREAGKVIEDAAEKMEYHFEEAKKNHYYTYNGDGSYTYEGSEKDAEGEPNVEQSGEGVEGCRRVVLDADFADVTFRSTQDAQPRAVCHYYSHKTAMLYPFYAKQEGDTFYVGVRRNQETEKKSGFFQFSMSPSIEIEIFLPAGVVLVEAGSSSGDMELNEITPVELVLHTKSGDINANYLVCDRISAESMSGDVHLVKTISKNVTVATKSGDCRVDRLEGVDGVGALVVRTASGDADIKCVQAATVEIGTASGDISADAIQGVHAKLGTASGDIDVNDCHGDSLEANTASGDISVKADYRKYAVKSQSGEVSVESRHDADVVANSTSGDVEIRIIEALETYQVSMHSVSGDSTTYGQTKSESTVPTKTIEAKTISGDINVRFL
ncbi:MAG: DUF4097 family beta strand repeat protein [Lachnospiraceae bacterium]|nr:DUF4097 family beta strand repeat protein [Lachnospiraceae bacterium]MBP3568621.1 DUF4097 family beta strand repeat protein [Lachnospiraceae bacterium]